MHVSWIGPSSWHAHTNLDRAQSPTTTIDMKITGLSAVSSMTCPRCYTTWGARYQVGPMLYYMAQALFFRSRVHDLELVISAKKHAAVYARSSEKNNDEEQKVAVPFSPSHHPPSRHERRSETYQSLQVAQRSMRGGGYYFYR